MAPRGAGEVEGRGFRWRERQGRMCGGSKGPLGSCEGCKEWEPEDQGAKLRAEAGWPRRAGAVVNAGQMPCWSGVPAPCRCRCCCRLIPVPFLGALPLADGSCLT